MMRRRRFAWQVNRWLVDRALIVQSAMALGWTPAMAEAYVVAWERGYRDWPGVPRELI